RGIIYLLRALALRLPPLSPRRGPFGFRNGPPPYGLSHFSAALLHPPDDPACRAVEPRRSPSGGVPLAVSVTNPRAPFTLPHHCRNTALCITAKLIVEWQRWVRALTVSITTPLYPESENKIRTIRPFVAEGARNIGAHYLQAGTVGR